ncbi:MAG: hypothetical protein LBL84_03850, partial [Candidatus Nomurabacteria bacterium]|nr:hypothetical protein [Candidatus Nomurabacteria bacterium]
MVTKKNMRKADTTTKRKPKAKATSKKTTTHKHVTLKAHHAKPYRKRHIGLFVVCTAALIVLVVLAIQYRDQILRGKVSSNSF